MEKKILIILLFAISLPLLPFNNCSFPEDSETTGSGSLNLAPINYLKNPKPNPVCGKGGYDYLLKEYFKKNCGTCHGSGGVAPPAMADANIDISFNAIKLVTRQDLLNTVQDNQFCGPDCNLDPRGEVYQAILEWYQNPVLCP